MEVMAAVVDDQYQPNGLMPHSLNPPNRGAVIEHDLEFSEMVKAVIILTGQRALLMTFDEITWNAGFGGAPM